MTIIVCAVESKQTDRLRHKGDDDGDEGRREGEPSGGERVLASILGYGVSRPPDFGLGVVGVVDES